jgi:hypothetical protein
MANIQKNKDCICNECRQLFLSYKRTTRYCSPKCNNEFLYKLRDIEAYNLRKRSKSVASKRRDRYWSDDNFRLTCVLRSRLNAAIKSSAKSGSAVKNLGCSIEELKLHLESKFDDKMAWSNYGRFGWHIDHREPLTGFDLSDPDQLKDACHYTNLQPLWWRENIIKGGA